ncbi:MAG: amidase family protein [Actinomycetota bacterium]
MLAPRSDSGGILARNVADISLAFGALSPQLEDRPPTRDIRVGFYEDDGYFPASTAIKRAVREAAATLQQLGTTVVDFSPPDVSEALAIFYGLFGADAGAMWRTQLAGGPIDPRIKDLLTLASMPNPVRPIAAAVMALRGQRRLARTLRITGRADDARVAELVNGRDRYRRRFATAMDAAGVDVLLGPPSCVPAFRHGTTRELGPASVSYTCLYNLLAYPAGVISTTTVRGEETTSRPRSREKMLDVARVIDEGSAGLPIGVQVVARPNREDQVLAIMQALEDPSNVRSVV